MHIHAPSATTQIFNNELSRPFPECSDNTWSILKYFIIYNVLVSNFNFLSTLRLKKESIHTPELCNYYEKIARHRGGNAREGKGRTQMESVTEKEI